MTTPTDLTYAQVDVFSRLMLMPFVAPASQMALCNSCLATAAGLAAAEPAEVQPDAVWTGRSNAEALHLQSPELRPNSNGDDHAAEANNTVCSLLHCPLAADE